MKTRQKLNYFKLVRRKKIDEKYENKEGKKKEQKTFSPMGMARQWTY